MAQLPAVELALDPMTQVSLLDRAPEGLGRGVALDNHEAALPSVTAEGSLERVMHFERPMIHWRHGTQSIPQRCHR
jgi:hypothetical protein